jgi:O-antigen ligase
MYGVIICCIIFLAFISLSFSKSYREKLSEVFLMTETQKVDARTELWKAGIEISKEYPFQGVGRSNLRDELSQRLDATSDIKNRGYNAHNQYFEFLLSYGIIILILLVLVLAMPMVKKYKTATIFVLYFSLAMLVESYLSRQSGIVIFSVFYAFFVTYDSKSK